MTEETVKKPRGPIMRLKDFFGPQPEGPYKGLGGFSREIKELTSAEIHDLATLVDEEVASNQ